MIEAPRIRAKIGRHLSYPLGFAEISNFLSTTEEQIVIDVWFWAYQAPRQNETREIYRVLEAAYDIQGGQASRRLTVSPVPRAIRNVVHSLLVPVELERVRKWLLARRTPYWYSTYHALRLDFDSTSERVHYHEHNAA